MGDSSRQGSTETTEPLTERSDLPPSELDPQPENPRPQAPRLGRGALESGEAPSEDFPPGEGPRGRTPSARKIDDPQRVDGGGGRWSVDASRRRCSRCSRELPDGEILHSALVPPPESASAEGDQVIFARGDYCEQCFEADPPQGAFAEWRTVLPPKPGGERKIVNLASLLAHFHSLVETSRADDDLGDGSLEDGAYEDGAYEDGAFEDGVFQRGAFKDGVRDDAGVSTQSGKDPLAPERARIAYLLALFLVRRRMLRWEGIRGGVLSLRCRESDRPLELPVPPLTTAQLAEAIAEFEDLFR